MEKPKGSEGVSINYQFKMYMEGIPCPFESAAISCTPNGVEMNVEVHPTDKIFDLKPKVHVAIFYKDFHVQNGKWRLMGEGYFSGFSKYDNAAGARTVSMICRDFRMDIRKTPAALVYQPDDNDITDKLYLANRYGIKKSWQQSSDDAKKNKVGLSSRTYGGLLRPFGAVISMLSKTAAGNDPDFSLLGDNGRFLLDAFARSIWFEATDATTYGSFINARIRADKRMVIPENRAGYRFLRKDYLMAFGEQVIFNSSMFSSVEAVIMRMGAIFQCSPVSCSTPNIILAKNAMCEQVAEHVTTTQAIKFGEPYVLNSCMILPPMQFTAPPNCNVVFPCMYDTITWQHDYDSDVTRAYFRVSQIFGGGALTYETKEIPSSLLNYGKGKDTPALTIEERFKGTNMIEGTVEWSLAQNVVNDSIADDIMSKPDEYIKDAAKGSNDKIAAMQKLYNEMGTKIPGDTGEAAAAYRKKREAFINTVKSYGVEKIDPPTVNQIMERHALMKFLMNRFSSRIITVSGQFNPYILCGFPAAILADENKAGYKTTRSIIGHVVSVRHQINTSGTANTQIVMNCCRFVSEPTDIDSWGNPLFVGDTDQVAAEINTTSYEYKNHKDGGPLQRGWPLNTPEDVSQVAGGIYDWKPNPAYVDPGDKSIPQRKLKWAKDVLTISREGQKQGKDNLNFADRRYTPTQIGIFYEEILGISKFKHFMLGRSKKPDGSSLVFMFDSIHEALNNLTLSGRMNEYFEAINFVKRDVVTEDDYFVKILGCSFRTNSTERELTFDDNTGEVIDVKYIKTDKIVFSNKADLLKYRIEDKWYGIPSNNEVSSIHIEPQYYKEIPPGEFGSIYERAPITPFLRERRKSVEAYIQEVNQRVNSTR